MNGSAGVGGFALIAVLAIVAVFALMPAAGQMVSQMPAVVVYEQPAIQDTPVPVVQAPAKSQAPVTADGTGATGLRNLGKAADHVSAAVAEVSGYIPDLKAKSEVMNFVGDVSPTLPEVDSAHTAKHQSYGMVKNSIIAWLANKTGCGGGVTAHLKTDSFYDPPALMVLTVCWQIGGNPKLAGLLLVDLNTKIGVTGYIANISQVCVLLRRDQYQPSTAPACVGK